MQANLHICTKAYYAGIQTLLLCLILCLSSSVTAQYYGMQFAAHEFPLNQRSSLNLTPENPISVRGNPELNFQLRFEPGHESYFGYIFRLIIGNQNIDLIHGIVPENPNNFELILGDKTSKIAFHVPLERLWDDWIHLSFKLDFENQQITCRFNDTVLEDEMVGFDIKDGIRLMFGAHTFGSFSTTDVPAMIVRDVELMCSDRKCYSWPLNETEGSVAHSVPEGNNGIAFNPGWLLKHHNTWVKRFNLEIPGIIKSAYDPNHENLYFISRDSLYTYNFPKDSLSMASHKPLTLNPTNEAIYDTLSNRLLLYSLDNQYISTYNSLGNQWSSFDQGTQDETQFWHHNSSMAPNGSIIAFGGYGFFQYKNAVILWDHKKNRFDTVSYKGDASPRYLAGSGFNPFDSLYYIIGGYGSESGKQSENPDYYYELLSFSSEESTFTKLAEFPESKEGFCFANSVVFDDSNNLYALHFSKYLFINTLQLVKVPLDKPEIIDLGNPIDYKFLDVNSYSDLHFSRQTKSLIAVTSYAEDKHTEVSVYSIAFPPQAFSAETPIEEKARFSLTLVLLVMFLLVTITSSFYFLRKRKGKLKKPKAVIPREASQKAKENSIILFGGFQVIDNTGKDITARFTPLPKKLFLFILLHSLRNNKGVSSNILYETFWFDKSVESARNNRAVNIVKLKSLLENLETASISKDTGYWKFDFKPDNIHIDYFEYLQIVRDTSKLTREHIIRLLSIIENRPFLNNTNADWLDPFKSEISNEIIDTILGYIESSKEDPEFLLHLTNCIFLFDSVSEEALKVKCKLLIKQGRHSLAKNAYSKFTKEYRQLYDEDYGISFNQLIEEN